MGAPQARTQIININKSWQIQKQEVSYPKLLAAQQVSPSSSDRATSDEAVHRACGLGTIPDGSRLLIRRGFQDLLWSPSDAGDLRTGLLRRNLTRKVLSAEIQESLPTVAMHGDRVAKRVASELRFVAAVSKGLQKVRSPADKKVVSRVGSFLKKKVISDTVLDLFAGLTRRWAFQSWKELTASSPLDSCSVSEEIECRVLEDNVINKENAIDLNTMNDKLNNVSVSQSKASCGKALSISGQTHTGNLVFSRLVLMAAASASLVASCSADGILLGAIDQHARLVL